MKPSRLLILTAVLATTLSLEARAQGAPAAKGDPAAGDDVFIKCSGCHEVGEGAKNSIGPELNGVVGRTSGSTPNYDYSAAIKTSGLTWDKSTLRAFLKDPKATVPGTKMNYAGLKRDKDVADLLAYLEQFGPDGKRR